MEIVNNEEVMDVVDVETEEVTEKKGGFLKSIPKVAKAAIAVVGGIFVAGAVYGVKVYVAAKKAGYTNVPKPGDATDPVTEADFAE